jgi:filamentous hemagglutinin family protein
MRSLFVTLPLVILGFLASINPVRAQVSSDGSLSTTVTSRDGSNFTIENGDRAGGNLFHSFSQFSVPTGGSAVFQNPDVQNIISRVTGGSISNIDGLIRTQGSANLFLLNPAGIFFGPNASLNIGGSFFGTTANSLLFPDGVEFSATNLQAPPLLSVNIPIGLRFRDNPGSITNQSIVQDINGNYVGLQVQPGKTLALVGGNVSLDEGELTAPEGRVELGGLAEPGNVNLLFDGNNFRLGFPENVIRADVSLTNQAVIRVQGAGGGDIAVNARNLEILSGSRLFAGIDQGLGTPETVAGDITLNATGEIRVADSGSQIRNSVQSGSKGNGGNIIIDTGFFSLRDDARLIASTFGQGNAGNVTIRAKDAVSLAGGYIFSTVEAGGVGKGGNIDINAATLSLQDGARIQTATSGASDTQLAGRGDAGNVNVTVTGAVDITGVKNGFPSAIDSRVDTGTVGNAGNITIDAGSFKLGDGAGGLATSTFGQGNAGNVTIRAKDSVSLADGDIFSTVEAGGVGNGGNIDINAASLTLRDGATLVTFTREANDNQLAGQGNAGNVNVRVTGNVDIAGEKNGFSSGIRSLVSEGTVGNGGNITIDAGSFSLRDGARLNASTRGQGNAGNININVTGAVTVSGSKDGNVSAIFSDVLEGAKGNGGNITIDAGSFSLLDGTQLITSTSGEGNAGNVTVRAKDSVSLIDGAIISNLDSGGVGKGGNIDIIAASLTLRDNGQLQTFTRAASDTLPAGRGDAGNVNVKVTGAVDIAGEKNGFVSGIGSSVYTGTVGNGGSITIDAGSFSLKDGARLETSTSGQGNAGKITINANTGDLILQKKARIDTSSSDNGNGGDITINIRRLISQDGSFINSSTDNIGKAGDVTVYASESVELSGDQPEFRPGGILATADLGSKEFSSGGTLTIETKYLSISDGSKVQAATFGGGDAGNLIINAQQIDIFNTPDAAYYYSTGIFAGVGLDPRQTELSRGAGGSLTINTESLRITNGGTVDTSTIGIGNAGNLTIRASDLIEVTGAGSYGERSNIGAPVERVAVGKGGNVNLETRRLIVRDGGEISVRTSGEGEGGNLRIKANEIEVSGIGTSPNQNYPAEISAGVGGNSTSKGGSLTIEANKLNIRNSGVVSVGTEESGSAGDLNITAKSVLLDNKGKIVADTTGGTGNIFLNSGDLILRRNSNITTNATGTAAGGNITINTDNIVAFPNENSDITANAFSGSGGKITINTQALFGMVVRSRAELERLLNTTEPVQLDPNKLPTNDITAISQQNPTLSGTVTINTPDINPSQGLTELPENVTDPSDKIAENACQRGVNSTFVVTGRGGLPSSPNQSLKTDNVRVDLVEPTTSTSNSQSAKINQPIVDTTSKQIIPARGWVYNNKGEVVLTAYDPTATNPQRTSQTTAGCPAPF